ncbi:MAG: lysylphosphatidylglycerol synthase domain-containing protein [Egibacteraceae bacterium]
MSVTDATRNRLLQVARWIYVGVLVAVVVWLVWSRREDLAELVAGARPGLLLLSLALALGQLGVNAGFWTSALDALGERQRWATVVDATARSVPTRYLPGSVWYALGRATLLHRAGASRRAVGTVAVLESALSIVVVLTFGAVLLLVSGRLPAAGWQVAAACVALAVLASPPVVNALLRLVARRRGGQAVPLTWRRHLRLLGWMAVFWAYSATTFSVYLAAFPGVAVGSVIEVAGSFMVAWGVGFLAVFAPQGAGVFELTVAALLTTEAVAGVAVVVGGYRALVAVRDAVAFGATGLRTAAGRAARGGPEAASGDPPEA